MAAAIFAWLAARYTKRGAIAAEDAVGVTRSAMMAQTQGYLVIQQAQAVVSKSGHVMVRLQVYNSGQSPIRQLSFLYSPRLNITENFNNFYQLGEGECAEASPTDYARDIPAQTKGYTGWSGGTFAIGPRATALLDQPGGSLRLLVFASVAWRDVFDRVHRERKMLGLLLDKAMWREPYYDDD